MSGCQTGAHVCQWRDVGDQVDSILDAYGQNETLASLAERFSADVPTIKAVLRGHGVTIRSAAELRRLRTEAQVATCTRTEHHCTWAAKYDVAGILGAYQGQASQRQVVRQFGLAPDTLVRILKAHGVARRTRQQQAVRVPLDLDAVARNRRASAPLRELAEDAGLSRQGLAHRLSANGFRAEDLRPSPCTATEHYCRWARGVDVARLLALYVAGASQRSLADRFSRAPSTVGRILAEHGIPPRSAAEQLAVDAIN